MINKYILEAYKIFEGKELSKELIENLSEIKGEDVLDLISLANKVKNKYAEPMHVCTIMNVKSGMCNEDCKFCSQSLHNNADIERYSLSPKEQILEQAHKAFNYNIKSFALVTSGTGYRKANAEFNKIVESIDEVHNKVEGSRVCASIGFLSDETAKILAEHNISNYNINLQTSVDEYGNLIASTHTIFDRIETIKLLKKNGVKVCSGGIIGVGETIKNRIDMAYTLKELDVDVIPLNVLVPIKGTPMENRKQTDVYEIAKTFAIFRLINPTKIIKFAAGRETVMKDFQALLMLSGANGFLTGGYLTTRGRNPQEDQDFEQQLRMF